MIANGPLRRVNSLPDAEPVAAHPPFEDVYALHVAAVYRFCLSQVREPFEAEDATADVFTAALKAYDRVRPGAWVGYWLFRIAQNTVVSHHRRRARQSRMSWLLGSRPPEPDLQLEAGIRQELREVAAAIATMRRRDRTLIGLRLAAQLSYEEIAAVLGMNEAAAKMATHRALKALRQKLEARS